MSAKKSLLELINEFSKVAGYKVIHISVVFLYTTPCLSGWETVNNHMHSCGSLGKPVRQVREPSEGFELKHSYYAQEAN